MAVLNTAEIQGMVLSGYGHLPYSAYLFLHFEDAAGTKSWVEAITPLTTTADWNAGPGGARRKPEWAFNVAFTCPGLERVGLKPAAIKTFSQEFREGITCEPRPRRLGDTGTSTPDRWEIGGSNTPPEGALHALLIIQAKSEEELTAHCAQQRRLFASGAIREVVPAPVACQSPDATEHFGFRDGIGQPAVDGSPNTSTSTQGRVKAGEFVLGYPNEYGVLPPTPYLAATDDPAGVLPPYPSTAPEDAGMKDFGCNGSYLVFRKLHQDVAAFRRYLREHCNDAEEAARVAAKMVGRWPSGAPLVLTPDQDRPELGDPPRNNAFGFAELDPCGYRCPVGAHIRRTNPRDALVGSPAESIRSVNRHRILRRGVRYGNLLPPGVYEDDGQPRGILFLCINADIERQFEFVQQTWANNPRFNGLYNDSDPLIGTNRDPLRPDDPGPWHMTIPAEPIRRRLTDLPRFVEVRGGAYLFMPSIAALHFLATLPS